MPGAIRPRLQAYLEEHPNQNLYRDKICKELDLTPIQVSHGINNMRRDLPGFKIEVVMRGQIWCYVPDKEVHKQQITEKRTFQEIGMSKSGCIIIQDDQGNVYKAEEI